MSSHYPIFVINLKRSPNRKANISGQLDALGLDYQFIEAVDGAQFTPYEIVEKYGEQVFYTNTYNHQRMTLGSLGCLFSHIKFYELMIENNISIACVLEDDAELSPRLPEVLNAPVLQQVPWGTLLLGHYSMYGKSFNKGSETVYWKKKVCNGHYIARVAEFPFTTIGYLIKLSTAKKLLDLAYPIRMPADWVTGNTELVGDILRVITPPCIVSNKEYREKSTVRHDSDTEIPIELQRETPTLSLMRRLTVGAADIILGTREQRAAAAFDNEKTPTTHRPIKWRLRRTSNTRKSSNLDDDHNESDITSEDRTHSESSIKHKTNEIVRYWKANQVRRKNKLSSMIKGQRRVQKKLWHRIKTARSIKHSLKLSWRLILKVMVMLFSASTYLIQDINRTLYYGKGLSFIRMSIKKLGLSKYTRVI